MYLELTKEGEKYRVSKRNTSGILIVEYVGTLTTDIAKATKALGVSESAILQLALTKKPVFLTKPPTCTFTERLKLGNEKTSHATFADAFTRATSKSVIEWGCARTTCSLDLDDFGLNCLDTAATLLRYHSSIWPSESKMGFHAIYHHNRGFDAIELAAMDAYRILLVYPDAKIDNAWTKTAMPIHGFETHESKVVAEYLEEHAASNWLAETGYKVGDRIPHEDCPVRPSSRSLGKVAPIELREHYVHCYICESDGVKMGSKHPGRFPYSVLSNDHRPTKLSSLIDNMVHYGHAKYAVAATGVAEPIARNLYSGLLKARHGVDDPRIPSVFTAGEPLGVVRYQGYWSDDSGSALVLDNSSAILKSLPAAQRVDGRGNSTLNAINLEWLSQPVDLTKMGYIPVVSLNGMQLTQFQTVDTINKIYKVREGKNAPKYLPTTRRLSEDDAWDTLATVFPKINRKAITALIVGRGCSEIRVGLPPMLFLSGSSGTGKTGHAIIAAAICGDSCTPVILNGDQDRFDNIFLTAKSQSGFVLFDEFFKFAKQAKLTEVEAMQSMLRFGSGTEQAYKIYIGAVKMGDMPMLIWADTQIPTEVMQHEQIGRRMYHLRLNGTMAWEKPLAESGIYEPRLLRENADDKMLLAVNSILSHIIEKWFTGPPTDYTTCMDELGIKKLNESEEIVAKNQLILDLFEAVCSRPDIVAAADKKRFSMRGMKIAKVEVASDPLIQAYELLQNEREKRTSSCRALAETDLGKVLGSNYAVEFQIRKHGSQYAMRFVSEDGSFVNKELIDA